MHIYHFSISGGLPEIYGQLRIPLWNNRVATGAFYQESNGGNDYGSNNGGFIAGFRASRYNAIYGSYNTGVRPDAVSIRVKTRAK